MRAISIGLGICTISCIAAVAAAAGSSPENPKTSPAAAASPAAKAAVTTSSSTASVPEGLVSAKEALGEDILDQMGAWNSAKYAPPSSTFRAGGVHPHPVDKDTVAKVGGGFR
ncbi:MAG TPA: hypothetical protein VMV18_06120, partial [bacterium]|nr:hypothetical protein [bacterium]